MKQNLPVILITGVAGLIGSRLADWIISNNVGTVIGIDDLSGGYAENVNANAIFYKYNIENNYSELDIIFKNHRPDYVFHMAAYAAEGLSPFIRTFNYKNNLVATAAIVNLCVNYNVKRLVFTSTMAVYGNNTTPFEESMIPSPIDPYGIAKYACEMDIKVAGEQHGLDWCIVRPHNVYGINQNIWDKYRNVLGIWMYQHLNGKPLTVFGDGEQRRAFSYVDDCLLPLWNSAILPCASNQIINIGGIKDYSINELSLALIDVMNGGNTIYLEPRHEVKYAWSTYQKSVDILNYSENTSLRDGLYNMWNWAKSQSDRNQFVWNSYEIERGVYSYWKV